MMPTVSAIIPTQHRPEMLREAAASVLGQTFRDLELIIVLNAATPEAVSAAEAIARSDERVRVVELARGSLPAARNAGLAMARGTWVSFLDDDDLWLPPKIDEQLKAADETGAALIACEVMAFNEQGDIGPLSSPVPIDLDLAPALTTYNYLPGAQSSALIRTAPIRALGGFDERMRACEDWDMWRRLAWQSPIVRMPQVLARYRLHDSNMSRRRILMISSEFRLLRKLTFDTPKHLRRMVPRAWMAFIKREAANVYAAVNAATGGLSGRAFRAVRRTTTSI